MKEKTKFYVLIAEGSYFDNLAAERALRDPFIEDWVEQTGKFRIHNFGNIEIAAGYSLADLEISILSEGIFKIESNNPNLPFTEKKAKLVAAAIEKQAIFDEITIEVAESV